MDCLVDGCPKSACNAKYGWCWGHYTRWRRHGSPTGGDRPRGVALDFIEIAVRYSGDECLLWPHATTASGYGYVGVGYKRIMAHRLVLERSAGPAPQPDMVAAHAPVVCHNRLCVNPRHLRWDSMAGNHADKVPDDTHDRGSRHPNSKLTESQVLAIRSDARPHDRIAAQYGISRQYVGLIRNRKRWAWLA